MKIKYKNDNVVVTFYEYIPSYPYQKDMVEMWSKSWAKQGWETIILGKEQAKTYPKYEKIIGAHWLTNSNWNRFLAACYKRYMAAWSYGDCLFCDPDVINYGWKYTNLKNIPRNKLAILGNGVPCLLYGTKEQYNNILEFYIDCSEKQISGESCKRDGVNDMTLIYDLYKDRSNFLDVVEEYPYRNWKTRSLVHYTHRFEDMNRPKHIKRLRPI